MKELCIFVKNKQPARYSAGCNATGKNITFLKIEELYGQL